MRSPGIAHFIFLFKNYNELRGWGGAKVPSNLFHNHVWLTFSEYMYNCPGSRINRRMISIHSPLIIWRFGSVNFEIEE